MRGGNYIIRSMKLLTPFYRSIKSAGYLPVKAIKNALVNLIPVLMTGAFVVVLRDMPITPYHDFIREWAGGSLFSFLNLVYNVTYGLMGVFMVLSIGYHYGMLRDSEHTELVYANSIICVGCFFVLSGTQEGVLSWSALGTTSMFIAIFSGLAASSLFYLLCGRMKPVNLFADGTDARLTNAIRAILPSAVVLFVFTFGNNLLMYLFGTDSFHTLIQQLFLSLFGKVGEGLPCSLLYVMLSSVLWLLGIHGSDVLEGVNQSIFLPAVEANVNALAAGQAPTIIFTKSFFDIFVLMGGCGSTLCLLIAILLFSRRRSNRHLAKISAIPMIFNVNEIMVFGLPVIYNPVFIIPFLATPFVCFMTGYLAMSWGLVPLIGRTVEWTTPVFFSGYIATGSINGVILQIVNLILGILIYRPFVLIYDKKKLLNMQKDYSYLLKIFQESELQRNPIQLTLSSDGYGIIAKTLSADLIHAMNNDELMIYYQPQYNQDGDCMGAEALLRWNHPFLGMIYPPLVFQLAKESGKLLELECWVASSVAHRQIQMKQDGIRDIKLSVNVTGDTIQSKAYEQLLLELSGMSDFSSSYFCIELTEQAALQFDNELDHRLSRIRQMGYHLAIDDFSMGHTSIKYLLGNQFDIVKLDGSIVTGLQDNPRCQEIISSIIQMSKSLGFSVLAEYVSNREIRDKLAEKGCSLYQGWYYSPAVPYEDFLGIFNAAPLFR